MSNIFKSNSRFAGLADDIPVNKDKKNDKRDKKNDKKNDKKSDKKDDKIKDEIKDGIKEDKVIIDKFNSFKDERPYDSFNSFKNNDNNGFRERRYPMGDREYNRYREEREAENIKRIELEKKEKERLQQEALKIENFPDLIVKNKKEIQQHEQSMSFIEKIKKESESNKIDVYRDPDLEHLKEGWVLFKRDSIANKTIIKKHPRDEKREYEENINSKKYEQEIIKEACRQLANLHEKRTNEYIELYGYDTWEKIFKFPGWREFEEEFDDNSDEDEDENNQDQDEDDYDNEY